MAFQNNFIYVLVIFNIGTLLAASSVKENYVIGGTPAEKGEFRYQVSIQLNGDPICGGSLFTFFWILTAASCVTGHDVNSLSVVVGVTDLRDNVRKLPVAKVILHENHTEGPQHDIALIKLKTCLLYNSTIRPVMLKFTDVPPGTQVIMTGFGQTSSNEATPSNTLQKISLKTLSNTECSEKLKSIVPISSVCTDNAVGQGYCTGDSGGPLVIADTKEQIGIAGKKINCAQGDPDVYTKISPYRKWIFSTAAKDSGGLCTFEK